MNIFDNFLHSDEINARSVRITEGRVMCRGETYAILSDARSDNELKKMSCVESSSQNSIGGQCRSSIPTMGEPVYMIEEELKTYYYFWIRNTEKLLLDRKCKP